MVQRRKGPVAGEKMTVSLEKEKGNRSKVRRFQRKKGRTN